MMVCVAVPYFVADATRRALDIAATAPLLIHHRSKIVASNRVAAQAGGVPGIALRQAHTVLENAMYVPLRQATIDAEVERLITLLSDFTARIEHSAMEALLMRARKWRAYPEQAHLFYVDLERLHVADARDLTHQIHTMFCRAIGDSIRVGLAEHKFTAYVAAVTADPIRFLLRDVADHLAPLPITFLPLEEATLERLHLLGLRTLGQYAALPSDAIFSQFNKYGLFAHQLARGIDGRTIQPYRSKQHERITVDLDDPIHHEQGLRDLLHQCAAMLATTLRSKALMGHTVTLRCFGEKRQVVEHKVSYRQALSQEHTLEAALIQLLQRFLTAPMAVTGVEVVLSDLAPFAGYQLSLFDHRSDQEAHLERAETSLRLLYGGDMFQNIEPVDEEDDLLEQRHDFPLVNEGLPNL